MPDSVDGVDLSVCVGLTPDPAAWGAPAFPIRFPAEDAADGDIEADAAVSAAEDVNPGRAAEDEDVAAGSEDGVDSDLSSLPGGGGWLPGTPTDPEPSRPEDEPVEAEGNPCVLADGSCVGEPPPAWALLDFQPQSCGFGATYGLQAFTGHLTVVALFASW